MGNCLTKEGYGIGKALQPDIILETDILHQVLETDILHQLFEIDILHQLFITYILRQIFYTGMQQQVFSLEMAGFSCYLTPVGCLTSV